MAIALALKMAENQTWKEKQTSKETLIVLFTPKRYVQTLIETGHSANFGSITLIKHREPNRIDFYHHICNKH